MISLFHNILYSSAALRLRAFCPSLRRMTKTSNASADGSQRKRNTNQSRSNVASKQESNSNSQQPKKANKPSQQQTNPRSNTSTPTSKPPSPPIPQTDKHVPLTDFNGDEIDKLLSKGVQAEAGVYSPEAAVNQKTGPWAQKRKLPTST